MSSLCDISTLWCLCMTDKILDICCGAGGFSAGVIRAGYDRGIGIDSWKGCRETFEYNHPEWEFVLGDISEIKVTFYQYKNNGS